MLTSKKDMAYRLGVSIATLERRVKRGELTPVYGALTQFGKPSVWFEVEDPEPSPNLGERPESPSAKLAERPESEPCNNLLQRPQSNVDAKLEDDFHFAEKYRQGEATDSFGNRIADSNADRTALGPAPPVEYTPPPSTTEHMDAALVGGRPLPGVAHAGDLSHPLLRGFRGVERPLRPLPPNYTRQELLNAMLRDVSRGWSR